ncbi:hypothetical protein GE061_011404 [Apolygus lucorum]|uniref:Helicase ATP-binding domain-containing protein n=1 Tax=Apolygus lucorum TaxID=248454 RepID=A0A6A4JSP8_APOLU|nr:hypothetical protein GE061_011404 [Apolygus lucorum]
MSPSHLNLHIISDDESNSCVHYISSDDELECLPERVPFQSCPKSRSVLQELSNNHKSEITTGLLISGPQTEIPSISPISKKYDVLDTRGVRLARAFSNTYTNPVGNVQRCKEVEKNHHKQTVTKAHTFSIFNRRFYLPKAHELPAKMGNQALTTFRGQQHDMLNSLKDLHSSLKNIPKPCARVSQPKCLKVLLLEHQCSALAWLLWRETEQPAGGIMADDMGLGKTLQMISLILKTNEIKENSNLHAQFVHRNGGGTLVVCPTSVIGHWYSELHTHVKKRSLSVHLYHGRTRNRNTSRIKDYDVVLTTYGTIQKGGDYDPVKSITWDRIILDEAHVIRNYKSQTASSIFRLKATKKWALTGTPVHNKSDDYYALVKFVGLKAFSDIAIWRKFVGNNHESGKQRLTVISSAIMLRRTKEDIKQSDENCKLTQKTVKEIKVELDPEEFKLYEKISHMSKDILARFIQEQAEKECEITSFPKTTKTQIHAEVLEMFGGNPNLEKWYKNFISLEKVNTHKILVLLLRLRQLCCHPYLIGGFFEKRDFQSDFVSEVSKDLTGRARSPSLFEVSNEEIADRSPTFTQEIPLFEGEMKMSSKIKAILICLKRILSNPLEDKVVVVSQWTYFLRLIEKFIKEKLRVTCLSLNGIVPMNTRQRIVDLFNSNSMQHRVLLLSLTAGGVGLNLVGGNHLLFVDLHWNPQMEMQAADRVYRFGQMKDVIIYKFICEGTIEERILKLQHYKLSLADGILGSDLNKKYKLTIEDMKLLFGMEDARD